ncbi:MAG: peptide ABC transporter substrate-binding protein [Clostridia bacterium]|nr:peptide ABC transporter substrate-binding protein [Clostridia bacterium]
MRKLLALVLALSLFLPLFAVAEDATVDLTACIASEPETIDPNTISSVDGSTYTQHAFEGLMKYVMLDSKASESENVFLASTDYGQAQSYTVSDDGLVYTFVLRDDIFWSDGEPVKAQDFVYSWQRIVDPATASDYGYILDHIVLNAAEIQAGEKEPSELAVKALDDKTLEVTLEVATPYFLGLCSFSSLVPVRQDIVEKYGAEWTNVENIVSNGAFVYSEWVHDSYIKMVRNEKYYDAANIVPDSITWYLSDSNTAMKAAFDAGEYMFFDSLTAEQISQMKADGTAFVADQIGTYYLYVSCDNVPDWRIRAAISLAIDRDHIVEDVTQGGQAPATGIVAAGILDSKNQEWTEMIGSPMYNWLAEAYPDFDLDLYSERCELAKKLVEEAVADGYDVNTTISYEFNTSETHKAIAEAVQSDVKDVLGLNMVLNNSEWQTYTNNLGEGKFGLARLGWIADYNDAITYLELFAPGNSYNYSNWNSEEYGALINQIKTLPGGEERDALMMQAENMIFTEGGFCIAPIYFYTQTYAIKPELKNVMWTPLGYFMFYNATNK